MAAMLFGGISSAPAPPPPPQPVATPQMTTPVVPQPTPTPAPVAPIPAPAPGMFILSYGELFTLVVMAVIINLMLASFSYSKLQRWTY